MSRSRPHHEFRDSRRILVVGSVMAAFILALSVWLVQRPGKSGAHLSGWIGIGGSGAFGIYFGLLLLRRPLVLTIDGDGFDLRRWRVGRVAWKELLRARVVRFYPGKGGRLVPGASGLQTVGIDVADPDSFLAKRSALTRLILRFHRRRGFGDLNVPIAGLIPELTPEHFIAIIREHAPQAVVEPTGSNDPLGGAAA